MLLIKSIQAFAIICVYSFYSQNLANSNIISDNEISRNHIDMNLEILLNLNGNTNDICEYDSRKSCLRNINW